MENNKACVQCKYKIKYEDRDICEIGFKQFPSSKQAVGNAFKNKAEVCHFIAAVYQHSREEQNDIHE